MRLVWFAILWNILYKIPTKSTVTTKPCPGGERCGKEQSGEENFWIYPRQGRLGEKKVKILLARAGLTQKKSKFSSPGPVSFCQIVQISRQNTPKWTNSLPWRGKYHSYSSPGQPWRGKIWFSDRRNSHSTALYGNTPQNAVSAKKTLWLSYSYFFSLFIPVKGDGRLRWSVNKCSNIGPHFDGRPIQESGLLTSSLSYSLYHWDSVHGPHFLLPYLRLFETLITKAVREKDIELVVQVQISEKNWSSEKVGEVGLYPLLKVCLGNFPLPIYLTIELKPSLCLYFMSLSAIRCSCPKLSMSILSLLVSGQKQAIKFLLKTKKVENVQDFYLFIFLLPYLALTLLHR